MSALRIHLPGRPVVFIDLGPAAPISRGQVIGGRVVRGAPGDATEADRSRVERRARVEVCE